ncbi:hypothetical protein KP509_22G008600 [Ceratopteris richardii]|nr:hypothetical protein KP509_22G008600 [Ceratopteris richardii]
MEPTSVNHGPSANVENVIRGSDEEQVLNRNDDGDHHGEEVIRGYGCQNLSKTPVAALMEEVQCMKDEPKHAGDLTEERNVSSTSEVANTVARRKNKNRTTGRLSESPDATLTSENARKYPICTEIECTGTELSCSSYPLPSIDGNGRLTGKFQMLRNNNPIPSSSLTEERRAPILTLQSEVNSSRCSHATYEGNTDNVLPMEEVWDEITAKKNAGNAMTYRAKNCQDSSDPACATEKVRDENKKRTRKKGRTMSTAKRDHSNHISCLSSFTVELNRQHPPQKNLTPLRRCDHGARHNSEARCEAPLEKRSSVNAAELQELNRRFEEFIARVNNEIRLQRLQSLAAREHSFPDTCADQHEKPNMGELPLHCLMAS